MLKSVSSWEDGYRTGAYSTPLFDDVAPKLKQWKSEGKTVAIYSSGSVFAQKLLMEHVDVQFDQTKLGEKRTRAEEEPVEEGSAAKAAKIEATEATGTFGVSAAAESANETKPASKGKQKAKSTEDLREIVSGWFDTTNAGLKADAQSYERIAGELKVRLLFTMFNYDSDQPGLRSPQAEFCSSATMSRRLTLQLQQVCILLWSTGQETRSWTKTTLWNSWWLRRLMR